MIRSIITSSFLRHAGLVVSAFTLLFLWLYASPIVDGTLLAAGDLYEEFLPQFLAPITFWSSYEFGGWPAFADIQDTPFYPPQLLGRLVGSWTLVIISEYVLAATFTYAYVYSLTRSRAAATLAGLSFGLSEALMERIAHLTVVQTTTWLPLMMLAVDRLRGTHGTAWVIIGACAIAGAILGGHPPVLLYFTYACVLYAITGALVERAGWKYFARLAGALALGVGLAAVKVLPLIEAVGLTARQTVSYGAFISHANTPAQMLSVLVPQIVHEGGEGSTYVGLAALVFALTAVWRARQNWRVPFWLALSVVAVLIASADATPIARMAYEVPLYDRLRIVGRHLILAAFGAATLAGFGLAAVRRGEVPPRAVYASLAVVGGGLAAVVIAIASWPDAFEIDIQRGLPWELPVWSGAVWRQLAVAGATFVACAGCARRPRSRGWFTILVVVLVSDLLLALPYNMQITGLDSRTIPQSAAGPSVHALRLAKNLAPQHQRLLAPAGTTTDDLVPAGFARVWKIPIAGGHNPMVLARYGALAMMGTNGSVDPLVLSDDNTALDLLAVKYAVLKQEDVAAPETFTRDGVIWPRWLAPVPVGPRECGQRGPRTSSFGLPRGVEIASIALLARLRCSEDVPQGTEVAKLRVIAAGGDGVHEQRLIAGVDVADAGLSDPLLRRRARHEMPRGVSQGSSPLSFVVRADLRVPARAARMDVQVTGTSGWLEIDGLTVLDRQGQSTPVERTAFLLAPGRWQEAMSYSTSRVTDRGQDEESPNEQQWVVYENTRARPRAWLAQEVLPLPYEDMLLAVHHSKLPDGRLFDPGRIALVDPDGPPARSYPGEAGLAVVRSIRDGAVTVDVVTKGGGFLVLSESFYPGWRARIGTEVVPVHRTNVSLQGVAVPAGYQRVEFELVSATLRAGVIVSLMGLGVLLFLAWRVVRARA